MTEGVALLDVNVLISAVWRDHSRHATTRRWLASIANRGFATCPMTQLGCVRILATPEVSRNHFTVRSAAIALRNFAVDSESAFWANDIDVLGLDFLATTKYIQGPRQLTDRYLLALAAANGGTLATFDRSLGASLPASSPLLAHLELIPF